MEVNKKAIFDNTFWQVFVRFVMLAITLVFIKLITNYLGVEGVGKYNTITTYINFFIVIADLGFFAVTVREISQNPNKEKKIISNVMFMRLISAVAACLLAIIIVFATKYDSEIKFGTLVATGFLFFNLLASVYDMVLQHRLKMQFSALAELIAKIINLIALILIIHFRGNFLAITSTIAIWGLFIFIFKYLFASRYLKFNLEFDRKISKQIFSMAWPLGIVFIVNNLYFKIDTLILFGMKGASAAGIYTVAYKVLEVIAFIGSYFSSALKPAISQNINDNKEIVANIIRKGMLVMILIGSSIAVISIAYNKEIITVMSNNNFIDSAKVLVFLALSLPLIYLDTLLLEIFIASDSRSIFLKISLFIFLFNVAANLLLIPRFSYFGAAAATLISEFILMQIYLYYSHKILPFKVNWPTLIKIVLAALATLLISYLFKATGIHFSILMFASLVTYAAILYLFKIFSLTEIKGLIIRRAE